MFGAEEALGIHIVIQLKPLGGVIVENDQQFLIEKLRPQDCRIDTILKCH